MTPRYRLISYNRTTDRIGGIIDIPAPLLKQVLAIAGIAMSASELGEHALTGEQVRDISSLIGVGAVPRASTTTSNQSSPARTGCGLSASIGGLPYPAGAPTDRRNDATPGGFWRCTAPEIDFGAGVGNDAFWMRRPTFR